MEQEEVILLNILLNIIRKDEGSSVNNSREPALDDTGHNYILRLPGIPSASHSRSSPRSTTKNQHKTGDKLVGKYLIQSLTQFPSFGFHSTALISLSSTPTTYKSTLKCVLFAVRCEQANNKANNNANNNANIANRTKSDTSRRATPLDSLGGLP